MEKEIEVKIRTLSNGFVVEGYGTYGNYNYIAATMEEALEFAKKYLEMKGE